MKGNEHGRVILGRRPKSVEQATFHKNLHPLHCRNQPVASKSRDRNQNGTLFITPHLPFRPYYIIEYIRITMQHSKHTHRRPYAAQARTVAKQVRQAPV